MDNNSLDSLSNLKPVISKSKQLIHISTISSQLGYIIHLSFTYSHFNPH